MGFVVTFGVFAAVGVLDGLIVEVVLAEMGCVVVVLVAAVVRGINLGVVLMDGPVGVVIVMVGVVVFAMVVVGIVGVVDVAVLGVVFVVGIVDLVSVTVFADTIVVLIVFPVMGDVARTAVGFPTVVVVVVVGIPAEVVVGDFPADGLATFCSEPESRKYQQITVTDA